MAVDIVMYTSRKWSSTVVEGVVVIVVSVLFFVANHDCSVRTMRRTPEQIKTNMTRHKIVPDVIDTFPEMSILIRYSEFVNADLGNELRYEDIEEYVPLISWKYEEGKYYTLIMLDPDSPTEQTPTKRSWVHWIVGNIPDYHVMEGEHIIEYQETRPANGTGFHRYVAMIFKQPQGKINFNESHIHQFNQNDENVRAKFLAAKFAEKYKLGIPLGINFFRAKWAYVNIYDYEDDDDK